MKDRQTCKQNKTRSAEQASTNRTVALAGNPNVGKSTVFNGLTGMKQHTGNWPGKTVEVARGSYRGKNANYTLVDLPGTYSLLAHSAEEEVARDFLCFEAHEGVIAVCDATCLERNLNLVLQIMEISPRVLVCVNLMDEAKRKGIEIDLNRLSESLGTSAVGISARKKKDLQTLIPALEALPPHPSLRRIPYPEAIENALSILTPILSEKPLGGLSARWVALKLLEENDGIGQALCSRLSIDPSTDAPLQNALEQARASLEAAGFCGIALSDAIAGAAVREAERIASACVRSTSKKYQDSDRRLDRFLTGRVTGYATMLLLLFLIFFLTVTVSNYPSGWLSALFGFLEKELMLLCERVGMSDALRGLLIEGAFRTLGWVVSVMLPPMAIFFPLFTLLEDSGYLPRIAYNLDRPFCRCNACGKQALTMCMGFGCNAVGVVGCRIVDSPRERLLAILTNAFVPCNGRFPALIAIITMFFVGTAGGLWGSVGVALLLTCVIAVSVLLTLVATRLLSVTLLRGKPSAFTLELPPYRPPQIGRVIVRSLLDRTLFVLGRAVAVAAPAGLILWIMANVSVGDTTLLGASASFLDPFARLLGVDGVILIAFILGLPANEIVIPIMLMAYLSKGGLLELGSLSQMREVLVANGWTLSTAISVVILFLLHSPCSTTLLTVKKETGSWKWTILAAALPTLLGILLCMLFTAAVRLFS